MSSEVELTLSLDHKDAARVSLAPPLRNLATAKPETRVLKSTYYDTHNADLRRRRLTLCVHRVGQGWLQTLEEDGAPAGALRPRVESEHPVARGRLDLNRIEDARLRSKLVRWHAAGELGPRFERTIGGLIRSRPGGVGREGGGAG